MYVDSITDANWRSSTLSYDCDLLFVRLHTFEWITTITIVELEVPYDVILTISWRLHQKSLR
jgi:hypothetical protein